MTKLAGSFSVQTACLFLCVVAGGSASGQNGTYCTQKNCPKPTSETTTTDGGPQAPYGGVATFSPFQETDSDANNDNFYGLQTAEVPGGQGSNTCYWGSGSPIAQYPRVTGAATYKGDWIIGGTNLRGTRMATNTWGDDYIGLSNTAIKTIQTVGPTKHITFPCVVRVYQTMVIDSCASGAPWTPYRLSAPLYITIYSNQVINERWGQSAPAVNY